MEKKTIKAILDVIKDVSDRPGLYGAQIDGKYIYFTDGYVAIRLEMGVYENLRPFFDAHNVWVSGEQLKEKYKEMSAKDVCLTVKNDKSDNHPDFKELWKDWSVEDYEATPMPIRPDTFKKLAPFGDMLMGLTGKVVLFNGKGVNAIACPLANL